MKRLIFFVMVLCSTVFSAENIQIAWQNDWKEVGTHGNYRAEWTKSIKMPEGCNKGEERRLDEIVLVSTNILHKKPTEWLNGKYLEYVNTSCDIWEGLKGTPKDFERTVDSFKKMKDKNIQNNDSKAAVVWISILMVGLGGILIFRKVISFINKML